MDLRELPPNPYFDPAWYAKTYGGELLPGEDPLTHYIRRGERENAWPSPHFDPEWYRDHHSLSVDESPLAHYLLHRSRGDVSPLPLFDAASYVAEHPDWRDSAEDPYQHWLQSAARQQTARADWSLASVLEAAGGNLEAGRIPEEVSWEVLTRVVRLFVPLIPFDEAWYCETYPDVAEAVGKREFASGHEHFIEFGFFEGRSPAAPRER